MRSSQPCRVGFEPEIVQSPAVLGLYAYWERLRGPREFPAKSDVDLAAIARHAANMLLLKVRYDPLDFEYRIVGDEVSTRLGSVKGRHVREAALLNVGSSAYRNYCAVIERRRPQFLEGWAPIPLLGTDHYQLSRVHCPLSEDGRTIDHILSCVTFGMAQR